MDRWARVRFDWVVVLVLAVMMSLAVAGCHKLVPGAEAGLSDASDAGAGAIDLAQRRVDAVEREVAEVVRVQEEALWNHWVHGASLDLSAKAVGHEELFSTATLEALRKAALELSQRSESAGLLRRRAANLEQWLVGAHLARALASEDEAVAVEMASGSLAVEGKGVAFQDVPRLLLAEESALKRRALWTAAVSGSPRLSQLLGARDSKAKECLAELGIGSPLEWQLKSRSLDVEALQAAATVVLEATDEVWRATLERLADKKVKLPFGRLTQADLPRLLQTPSDVDEAFPKDKVAERGSQLLTAWGLDGAADLHLDVGDRREKNPLPLTVAPRAGEVRLSYRPSGGLRDQAALLEALGTALALRSAHSGQFALDRLGDSASGQVLADLVSGLVGSAQWLSWVGVAAERQAAVIEAWKAQRLYVVRRSAGIVLGRLAVEKASEAEVGGRYLEVMRRALGVQMADAEAARWRIDLESFPRAASQLKAAALAEVLRVRFAPDWFAHREQAEAVFRSWEQKAAVTLEERVSRLPKAAEVLGHALNGGHGEKRARVSADAGSADGGGGGGSD